MQQYADAKRACGDALLLFRMGDFYELFYEDAKTAARVLGLTLTSRDKGENPIPMAGFPHHQLETYLGRLISFEPVGDGHCHHPEWRPNYQAFARKNATTAKAWDPWDPWDPWSNPVPLFGGKKKGRFPAGSAH